MPQVMYSFFDEYAFSGKTVISFNSHGGTGFSGSVEKIAQRTHARAAVFTETEGGEDDIPTERSLTPIDTLRYNITVLSVDAPTGDLLTSVDFSSPGGYGR